MKYIVSLSISHLSVFCLEDNISCISACKYLSTLIAPFSNNCLMAALAPSRYIPVTNKFLSIIFNSKSSSHLGSACRLTIYLSEIPFSYNKAEFSLIHINDVYLNAPISFRESSTKFRERARLPIFNIFFYVVTYYTKLDIACEEL